jgi:hypothetical protein
VKDEFWVDTYVNPNPPPTHVNEVWYDGHSQGGVVWGITSDSLPMLPGTEMTLTLGDSHYHSEFSSYHNIPAGSAIYAQVDAVDLATTYGGVLEVDEFLGLPYNNIMGPVYSTAGSATDSGVQRPGQVPDTTGLPPRPNRR